VQHVQEKGEMSTPSFAQVVQDPTRDLTLLKTKLFIPPVRPELVSRPRLLERLEAALDRKLTLFSAPAGFGKTSLLSECATSCERRVAWVSLDKGDNDPYLFWSYVVAALETIQPGVGGAAWALLHSSGGAAALPADSLEMLLTTLINDLADIPEPFILILDDVHLITEPQIHQGLTFLLDHLPPQMHLVLSGRTDPPWPLARLRARGEMTELRAADLRFTPQETEAFLNEAMSLKVSAGEVDALSTRTEGWIAGLQMAAISMRGHREAQGEGGLSSFIKAFTGSHRFILDYLVEEVLSQQPPAIQEFLLKTSILERMNAPLCAAVCSLAADHSQEILLGLESGNLFLVPLDDERHWYRYHHLFADLLHSHLQQAWPDRVPALHLQACAWYEEQGLVAEAVSHALAASDFDRAAHLVETHALEVIYQVELTSVVKWLSALPARVIHSRPWLCVAHAWALLYAGEMDAVESRLRDAEDALAHRDGTEPPDDPDRARIEGHIATIRAYAAVINGEIYSSVELAREAMAMLPDWDTRARSFAAGTLGSALRWTGDLAGACRASEEAIAISLEAGERQPAVVVLTQLAAIRVLQGRLHAAAASCREALELEDEYSRQTGRRMPVTGYALAHMSQIAYEWNDLQTALRNAREGLDLCKQWGQKTIQPFGYMVLAHVLQALGDDGGALDAVTAATEVARRTSPWLYAQAQVREAEIRLAQGDVAAAARWAERSGLKLDGELTLANLSPYATLARVLILQGKEEPVRLDQAQRLLGRLRKLSEATGTKGSTIKILILEALALQASGALEPAMGIFERALSLAEREGHVRVFVDYGAPIAELLRQAAARGMAPKMVGRLLNAFGEAEDGAAIAEEPSPTPVPARPGPQAHALVESLTEREQEVLRLLGTSLSVRDIAGRLHISVHTVRSHTKNIYGKLGVNSRMAAVARATELGFL
jgi:LuxR family maltose regulon positive regulatory protein